MRYIYKENHSIFYEPPPSYAERILRLAILESLITLPEA